MNSNLTIPMSHVSRNLTVTVKVTGMRVFRVRWWLATQLMWLAARVAGCGLKVDLENAA